MTREHPGPLSGQSLVEYAAACWKEIEARPASEAQTCSTLMAGAAYRIATLDEYGQPHVDAILAGVDAIETMMGTIVQQLERICQLNDEVDALKAPSSPRTLTDGPLNDQEAT